VILHVSGTFAEAIRSLPRRFRPIPAVRPATRVHISTVGPEPGNWMVTVRGRDCFVEEGSLARTNLRIHIPSDIALQIIRGEMDAGWAYANGLLVAYGESAILREFNSWFGEATPER
jgi:hypothetical protein